MKQTLYLMCIKKIPKKDLKRYEGKKMSEIIEIAKSLGYELLYFNLNCYNQNIISTSKRYNELFPYLSDIIHTDVEQIIDEEKIKKDFNVPSNFYCEKLIVTKEGTKYIFEDSYTGKEQKIVFISDKVLKEKYMKNISHDVRMVYVQKYGSCFEGSTVDYILSLDNKILSQSAKTMNYLDEYYFKMTYKMYEHAKNSIYYIPFVSNSREALFYKYENC